MLIWYKCSEFWPPAALKYPLTSMTSTLEHPNTKNFSPVALYTTKYTYFGAPQGRTFLRIWPDLYFTPPRFRPDRKRRRWNTWNSLMTRIRTLCWHELRVEWVAIEWHWYHWLKHILKLALIHFFNKQLICAEGAQKLEPGQGIKCPGSKE